MKNILINRIMLYRLDMDNIGDIEEIKEGYRYLETLTNIELLKILIDWKYNR